MQLTTNLGLKKPQYTDPVDIEDINYNMSILDIEVAGISQTLSEEGNAGGVSTFSGSGLETTIPHGLNVIPTSAYAFPIANPGGYLGEVWIRMDDVNLYVGNTGSYTAEMVWTAIK